DFHGGSECRFEWHIGNADETNERRYTCQFCGKEAKPMLPVMSFDALRDAVALLPVQARRKELHHLGVGIQKRERLPVGSTPWSQQKSRSSDHKREFTRNYTLVSPTQPSPRL